VAPFRCFASHRNRVALAKFDLLGGKSRKRIEEIVRFLPPEP
jgi:hypothetical protein